MRVVWPMLALAMLLHALLAQPCASRTVQEPDAPATRPILIGRCSGNCLYEKMRQEHAFYFADAARYGRVAIRLCSAERFELAVAKASYNISTLVEELRRWPHVKPGEIALLLARDCMPSKPGRVTTEFWAVPSATTLPAHEREAALADVSLENVGEVGQGVAMRAAELIRRLRQTPDTYGVVLGTFYRRPAPSLKRSVRDAARMLRAEPDLRGRYATSFVPYGFTFSNGLDEPTEPSFMIVRISKKEDAAGGARRPSPR